MGNAIKILTSLIFFSNIVSPTLTQAAGAVKQTKPVGFYYNEVPEDVKTIIKREMVRDLYLRFSQVKTSKDFENFFLGDLPAPERKEFVSAYFPLKKLPGMKLEKGVLTVSLDKQTVSLEVLDPVTNSFLINGKKWDYSPRISLFKNSDNLGYFLAKKGNMRESAMRNILLPNAEAFPPIIVAALVGVLTALLVNAVSGAVSKMGDVICQLSQENFKFDWRRVAGLCSDWFEKRKQANKDSGVLPDGNTYRLAYEARARAENYELDILSCPAGPGKDGDPDIVLKSKLRRSAKNPESLPIVPLAPGNILDKNDPSTTGAIASTPAPSPDKETLRAWNQVVVKLRPNLDNNEIAFYPDGVDTKGPAAESNLMFRVVYNSDNSVKRVDLRNNLYKPDDGSSPTIPIDGDDVRERLKTHRANDEADANLTTRLSKADEMSKYLIERAKECAFRTQSGAERIPGLSDKVIKLPAVAPVETTPANTTAPAANAK